MARLPQSPEIPPELFCTDGQQGGSWDKLRAQTHPKATSLYNPITLNTAWADRETKRGQNSLWLGRKKLPFLFAWLSLTAVSEGRRDTLFTWLFNQLCEGLWSVVFHLSFSDLLQTVQHESRSLHGQSRLVPYICAPQTQKMMLSSVSSSKQCSPFLQQPSHFPPPSFFFPPPPRLEGLYNIIQLLAGRCVHIWTFRNPEAHGLGS